VQPFDAVSVIGDYYQVFLHIDDPWDNVILEGESNILPAIYPQITMERLYISTYEDVCIYPGLAVKLDVYSPKIKSIALTGNSTIITDSISIQYFRIYNSGRGLVEAKLNTDIITVDAFGNSRVNLKGITKRAIMNITDNVLIDSYAFKQDSCYVTLIGSSKVYVNVSSYLNVKIDGDGIVYYTGHPAIVETEISGSGKVIEQN